MVFYDFASIHQKDPVTNKRTDEENKIFKVALKSVNKLYAHRLATTYALDVLPRQWRETKTPYDERGWPHFEASASALIKEAHPCTWARHVRLSEMGRQGADSQRVAPVHPEAFAATLALKEITNGADCEILADLYADALEGAFGTAEDLIYSRAGWDDDDIADLARALDLARRATVLDVSENDAITADGWRALAHAIAAGSAGSLKRISVTIGRSARQKSGVEVLRQACDNRDPPIELHVAIRSGDTLEG